MTPVGTIDSPEFEMLQYSQSSALVPATAQDSYVTVAGQKSSSNNSQKQEGKSWEKIKDELSKE